MARAPNRSALIAALQHAWNDFTVILGDLSVPTEQRHRCWVRANRIQELLERVRNTNPLPFLFTTLIVGTIAALFVAACWGMAYGAEDFIRPLMVAVKP